MKLLYLLSYSPNLNPIEEFFTELKMFIKRNWQSFEDFFKQSFKTFLKWCMDTVGVKEHNAEGHFRYVKLCIKQL